MRNRNTFFQIQQMLRFEVAHGQLQSQLHSQLHSKLDCWRTRKNGTSRGGTVMSNREKIVAVSVSNLNDFIVQEL
jgi:hypothetical protein